MTTVALEICSQKPVRVPKRKLVTASAPRASGGMSVV